jgi:hypothetical protein
MSLDALFTETMDVYGKADGRSESGGLTRTAALREAGVACRVQDASASQKMAAASLQIEVSHQIFTAYSSVTNGDTVVVGGVTYRVQGVQRRRAIGGMDGFYVVTALEIST